jgi:rhodanese-related sulfurtransferase
VQAAVVDVTREEVRDGIAGDDFVLIDVREPQEFDAGHIPGSLSMPLSAFDPADLAAFAGKRIVFSCAAGVRSIHALMMAQAAGLALNEHYRGGFRDWVMAGELVER